jgi:hypothetical protein
VVGLVLSFLWLAGMPASAEAPDDYADRWIPGFSLESGIRSLEADYSIETSERGFFENDSRPLFFFVGGGLHLATPVVLDVEPQVRLFGRFGAATSFDGRFGATNEGAPGKLIIPVIDLNGDGIPDGEPFVNTISGLGSSTQSRSEPLILSASLGADLLFEFVGRRLHVKPSIEWIWQEDQVVGLLGFAESMNVPPDDPNRCPCRTGFIRAEKIEAFNGIGPGLEFELEASRIGQGLLTVYFGAKAFYALDTEVVLNATARLSDDSGDISLRAVYERNQWDYLAGVGFRLHWLPE